MSDGGIAFIRTTQIGGVTVNFTFGHLDRMPRCQHGRVICRSCEEAQEGAEGPVVLDQHVEANTSQPRKSSSQSFPQFRVIPQHCASAANATY